MLRKVKRLAYEKPYTYAPLQEEALVNDDMISCAVPVQERGGGPFVRLRLSDGSEMTVAGVVDDFLKEQ